MPVSGALVSVFLFRSICNTRFGSRYAYVVLRRAHGARIADMIVARNWICKHITKLRKRETASQRLKGSSVEFFISENRSTRLGLLIWTATDNQADKLE